MISVYSIKAELETKAQKWLPGYDIEHHQIQPSDDRVQHLFQY